MFRTSYRVEADGVVVLADAGRLRIQVLDPGIMRVVQTRRDRFGTAESLMVLPAPATAPHVSEVDDGLLLSAPALRLAINSRSGAFTWTDATGRLLVREPHEGTATRTLEETEVHRPLRATDAHRTHARGVDGPRTVTDSGPRVVDRIAYSTTLRLELSGGEAIHGLGQHIPGRRRPVRPVRRQR
ncbi:DUF4968 domain-containing protein [Streptomyces sp. NPDC088350]|uniref:DUF4968 domain-containing protein n=1 Tax=Streptomyces sp. NPDC088350 TaxID=3365854 RepID=UPI00381ACBBC